MHGDSSSFMLQSKATENQAVVSQRRELSEINDWAAPQRRMTVELGSWLLPMS